MGYEEKTRHLPGLSQAEIAQRQDARRANFMAWWDTLTPEQQEEYNRKQSQSLAWEEFKDSAMFGLIAGIPGTFVGQMFFDAAMGGFIVTALVGTAIMYLSKQ